MVMSGEGVRDFRLENEREEGSPVHEREAFLTTGQPTQKGCPCTEQVQ